MTRYLLLSLKLKKLLFLNFFSLKFFIWYQYKTNTINNLKAFDNMNKPKVQK